MTSADPSAERIAANVAQWTKTNREWTDADAERQWRDPQVYWGEFDVRDEWLGDVAGLDVVELGAGTAYFSARLARAGARPVAVDPTPAQLETARRLQRETGLEFPLVEAPAEQVPLPDASFDLAVSEYGASLWADPERWLAEAARLLRPGGRLFFLTMSTLAHLCTPDEDGQPIANRLVRPQFSAWETRWEGYLGVEYHLSHGDWIALLRANGFRVDALHELQAPSHAQTHEYYLLISAEWAQRWPGEDLWECTKSDARRLDGARPVGQAPALPVPERGLDSIAANVAEWTQTNAEHTDASAERAWAHPDVSWGVFTVPEEQVGALPESVDGLDVVELGCGTAYFGSWLARRGARVTGVDPTPAQLATARRMMVKTGIEFPLVEAPGEAVPLPDQSYDLALSEYGASLWADPYKWIAEAARLLRPDGLLVFLVNSTLVYLTAPQSVDEQVGTELLRDLFGMYRIRWDGATGIEYHLTHGEWIRLLREHGFEIEALHELRPQPGAVDPSYYDFVTVEWAAKWPAEEVWVARRRQHA